LKDRDIFFDLSPRIKLRIAGNDRLRFLNGQLTADIRKTTASSAVEACLLDAKGKMNAHVFVFASTDFFLLDAAPELKETLQARLERYVIADDVIIEDVTDQWSILHLASKTAAALLVAKWITSANRFGRPGLDLWIEASERAHAFEELSREFEFYDSDRAEILRIEQGIPRWGRELTDKIIPVEANLERSIDYEKGCYIGQEVVSRMKMSGQRNKNLCGLISKRDLPLSAGMDLVDAPNGKNAGWITSAVRSEKLGREIALGYVKRGLNATGTALWASAAADEPRQAAEVIIVDLPFSGGKTA
jgi:folate-binding protein YgfZ